MKVFVAGATGRLGKPVARRLLERGHEVRGLTRSPQSEASQQLRVMGVEVIAGDFDDAGRVGQAMRGVDAAFVITTPHHEAGTAAEVRHAVALANAAAAAGVGLLVYGSAAGAHQSDGVPMLASKAAVEEHLHTLGVPYAVVAPVYFMENLFFPWNTALLRRGRLPLPLPRETRVQLVSVGDVAAVTAVVLEYSEAFAGQRVDVAADELTGPQVARILSERLGRTIRLHETVPEELGAQTPLFRWMSNAAPRVDIPELRRRFPQVGWQEFPEWAAGHDWNVVVQPAG